MAMTVHLDVVSAETSIFSGLVEAIQITCSEGELAEDLDEQAALDAQKRAEEHIANPTADFEYAEAAVELAEAIAQLRLIRKLRK